MPHTASCDVKRAKDRVPSKPRPGSRDAYGFGQLRRFVLSARRDGKCKDAWPVGYLIQLAQRLPSAILSGMHNEVRSDLRVGRFNKRQCSNILLNRDSDLRYSQLGVARPLLGTARVHHADCRVLASAQPSRWTALKLFRLRMRTMEQKRNSSGTSTAVGTLSRVAHRCALTPVASRRDDEDRSFCMLPAGWRGCGDRTN